MPPKTLFRLGLSLLLIAAAVYSYSGYWLRSRIFVPLDSPVTLDTRQIKSPPFEINLRETYYVFLDLDYSHDDWRKDALCSEANLLAPHWRVYRLSPKPGQPRELWASSEELIRQDRYAHAFIALSGQYELEWDLAASAPCLDRRHPRLRVTTDSSGYEGLIAFTQIGCIFMGGTGVMLVLLVPTRILKRHFLTGEAPRIFPDMVLRNVLPISKHAPLPPIHNPPHWGLFCAAIFWILICVFMVLQPLPSMGLFVPWRNHDAVVWEKSPWPGTLEVTVRTPARFFINNQEVERGELRAKLLDQLNRRTEWSVYFEADPDTLYMDDIYAIDTIQGCGAELIWITPKMRQEWQRKTQSLQRIP
jgi:biopolymer transport protein ExbD